MTNEEIILGAHAAGKKRITCPVCGGGDSREEDSMSIWADIVTGSISGICYRATCGTYVRTTPFQASPSPAPSFAPRPLKAPYRLVTHKDAWGEEWCSRTEADPLFGVPKIAHERGFRVLTALPDVAVWRLRALDGVLTGHITRTLDKKISTYKDLDRSLYYWNGVYAFLKALFVFEDPLSAALCGHPAIALLGTSIADNTIQEIKKQAPKEVLVCLDPGAEDAALKVYERLVANGVPAVFVPMAKDYKDMTLEERKILEETYA